MIQNANVICRQKPIVQIEVQNENMPNQFVHMSTK